MGSVDSSQGGKRLGREPLLTSYLLLMPRLVMSGAMLEPPHKESCIIYCIGEEILAFFFIWICTSFIIFATAHWPGESSPHPVFYMPILYSPIYTQVFEVVAMLLFFFSLKSCIYFSSRVHATWINPPGNIRWTARIMKFLLFVLLTVVFVSCWS